MPIIHLLPTAQTNTREQYKQHINIVAKKFPTTSVKFAESNIVNGTAEFTTISEKNISSASTPETKFSYTNRYSQNVAREYHKKGKNVSIVIFANAYHPGGGGEKFKAQEEGVLKEMDAPYFMPNEYGQGLILQYGGLYAISNVNLWANGVNPSTQPTSKDISTIKVSTIFVAMPNFQEFTSRKNYDNHSDDPMYLRHIISLVMLQFYTAKHLNSTMITGQQGCGVFGNQNPVMAPVLHAVASLPEFQDVEVVFCGLGKDELPLYNKYEGARSVKEFQFDCVIHDQDDLKIIHNIKDCIESIIADCPNSQLDMNYISTSMMFRYAESRDNIKYTPQHLASVSKHLTAKLPVTAIQYVQNSQTKKSAIALVCNKDEADVLSGILFSLGLGSTAKLGEQKFIETNENKQQSKIYLTLSQFELLKYRFFCFAGMHKHQFSESELYQISDEIEKLRPRSEGSTTPAYQAKTAQKGEQDNSALELLYLINTLHELGYPKRVIVEAIKIDIEAVHFKLTSTSQLLSNFGLAFNVAPQSVERKEQRCNPS